MAHSCSSGYYCGDRMASYSVNFPMTRYDADTSIIEARAQYFTENGFGEGGYTERWVKLKAGPIPLAFPNTSARVTAVRFHDIHHVLTEYQTNWTGEAEIGAWEIASGCAHHYAAWLLNLQAMAIGLIINPKAIFHAFLRGRRSHNLYREEFGEALLSPTVGELRQRLRLDTGPGPATLIDYSAFIGWSLASMATFLGTNALLLVPFWLLLYFL
jgi:hypothetical protein